MTGQRPRRGLLRWRAACAPQRLLCLGFLAALFAVGCRAKKDAAEQSTQAAQQSELKYGLTKEQSAQVLVKAGATTITLGEFAKRLAGQSPYWAARYNSPERRREFLDNMVRFELMAAEAEKHGYDRQGDVDRARKEMMVQQMMQDLFDKQGVKLSDISYAEIQKYYDDNKSEFEKPAQMRASQILVKDKATAGVILAKLKQSSGDMQVFRKLAEQYNEDPQTKDTFGDLRFFSAIRGANEAGEPERPDPVRKAVFTLEKVGDVYGEPVKSEKGFHLLELTGKSEAQTRTVEAARAVIQNRLWRSKRDAAIEKFEADLRSNADMQEHAELLSEVHVDSDAPATDPHAPR